MKKFLNTRLTFLHLIIWMILLTVTLSYINNAYGHEWYSPQCCSSQDCAPLKQWSPNATVTPTSEGYHVFVPGHGIDEIVPYNDFSRLRGSQDNKIHLCIQLGDITSDTFLQCVYLPGSV